MSKVHDDLNRVTKPINLEELEDKSEAFFEALDSAEKTHGYSAQAAAALCGLQHALALMTPEQRIAFFKEREIEDIVRSIPGSDLLEEEME